MLPGYNHNVQYKGKIYHIQTEDSGVQNPHIITLLYEGGNILGRKKTSYEDILKSEKLPLVVKEMMQEQHKSMLRDLKGGTFDGRIYGPPKEVAPEAAPGAPHPPQAAPPPPPPKDMKIIELKEGEDLKDEDIFGADLISDKSLDEVILNYLSQNLEDE